MTAEPTVRELAPLSRFSAPTGPKAGAARGRAVRFWRSLMRRLPWRESVAVGASEGLDRLEADRLGELLPANDIEAIAAGLEASLDAWAEAEDPSARVVVAPPGSEAGEACARFAADREWPIVEAPARAALAGSSGALDEALEALDREGPVALCRLEHWFLRREVSLPGARRLIEALACRRGPTLVACDSWAWAFLRRAAGAQELLGEPLAPMALDGASLARWLAPAVARAELVCRDRSNRQDLFAGVRGGEEESGTATDWMVSLAAAARGVPGVASALWRSALRSTASDEDSDPGAAAPDAATQSATDPATLWVVPVHDAERDLPVGLGDLEHFVLHAVLLHGGLERELLPTVLPLPAYQVQGAVRQLQAARVLAERDGRWTVDLAALPGVRDELETGGFLLDDF